MPYKSRLEYVDELPETAVKIDEYRGHKLDEFYYDETTDTFYTRFLNADGSTRRIHVCKPSKNGVIFSRCIEERPIYINPSKFKASYESGRPSWLIAEIENTIAKYEAKLAKLKQERERLLAQQEQSDISIE